MVELKVKTEMDVDRNLCNYCGACVGMCPTDAIWLDETVIKIHEEKCIECGFCIVGCPTGAITAEWFHGNL
ncbi:ferredoxin 2[4Fe-4S] related protin [Thermoplasma acidophilum]|uniref:Probable ferredoxin TA0517 n=1 Tax=Thermoplasma acidophilum (strain ATCC 25905 / DSM 1728 / JCM 9062 / NBRC 15155 / AMRC-C165) TaxID=273075 RepID=FER2_THEAC|nr:MULTISPECIES: 4Fe-4S binding protein [Thermoplasma]P82853.1 RecName: Full=Probable ferredoxin TA0517 [Thermoplasma acidophilum DSM 1728]KAA8923402.1 MAG: 4Fe-4S dicluster domain-containing protein [Thermoplasma sp.]MCY0852386.1 4Fe-4S binding protein [Thermoplasma acidophilum]CAC11657.1 ferredoxin 2[4Fe-4S] related protin [Thermoplasma acidophilum]